MNYVNEAEDFYFEGFKRTAFEVLKKVFERLMFFLQYQREG